MRPPLQLPSWWTDVLRKVAGVDVDDAAALRGQLSFLRQLTEYLNQTGARQGGAQRYMKDRRLRGAYLLYYSTANMLKPWRPLRELSAARALPVDRPLRVLDLGAGPGTAAAGLAALLPELLAVPPSDLHIAITALDAVGANLAMYRQVAAEAARMSGCGITVETAIADVGASTETGEAFDLVLAMNVVNELPPAKRARFLAWSAEQLGEAGHLLIIEPALRETSRDLLTLRDAAVQDGWTVCSPCLRQADCPALEKPTDWCHDDVSWQRPEFIEILDEGMGNIKKSLKYSYLLLNRHGAEFTPEGEPARSGQLQRVVSERFDEKGRVWWHMCGREGRQVCQRNHRDRTPGNEPADTVQRYDIIALQDAEVRKHDVRIPSEGKLYILDGDSA